MNDPSRLRCYLTARDGIAALAVQPPPRDATADDAALPRVWIDPARSFQTVLGFGGAFTEAAAVTWMKLGEARREELLHVKVLGDGWTAVTRDRSLSAQYEHTIGVTAEGCKIFTASPKGLDRPGIPS